MSHQTLIRHPRLRVSRTTGSEGPRHDPYSYERLHVETPSGETVLHLGLGAWLDHNGYRIEPNGDDTTVLMQAFEKLTGYTPIQLQRICRKRGERCRECGGKELRYSAGFPGEHFELCANCGGIINSYFNESEII